jgi:molybdopterin biosynthesis enzyme MoaB
MASDQNAGGGYRMMVDVLSDDDLKAQLLHEMQVALIKWKKQIHLLDKETAAIIDALEGVILQTVATKRKAHGQPQDRKAG